jgi:hypothetical protein
MHLRATSRRKMKMLKYEHYCRQMDKLYYVREYSNWKMDQTMVH